MNDLWSTFSAAIAALLSGDPQLWSIVGVSFGVSASALLIALLPALTLGFVLAYFRFPGRWVIISLFNSLLAVPTVVVGLVLYMLLSRAGPLGDLQLLFTRPAMIIGQILLCFPLLVAMSLSAFQAADYRVLETAKTLGASPLQAFFTLLFEVRFALLAALVTAFGRIIAEVGSAMMVGGNILHHTRNITTAIALETGKGEFVQGVALGIVLLVLALVLNVSLGWMQSHSRVLRHGT
ncbi:ABC transporter permease [Oceanospirillaceae bacterium]|jgi:tungstate transport system permease protein|nr:ABC transporter permease [Oceanospirillaceae bacterium]MDC1341122.1 ABC transporter permease [Oceanospirillaceae bacterium]|tara:strand:+ start:1580 stop:2290 length:711 start_codon:yes stop_codon:yes gene_type:complete